jgi:excisionase family DNA binding protein
MMNTDESAPLLVSVTDAAALLGIGRVKFYELLSEGAIRPVRIGRRTLIAHADLVEYVEARRRTPPIA